MIYIKRVAKADVTRQIDLNNEAANTFFNFYSESDPPKNLTFEEEDTGNIIHGTIKKSGHGNTITGDIFSLVKDKCTVEDILVFKTVKNSDKRFKFSIITSNNPTYSQFNTSLELFGSKHSGIGTTTHLIAAYDDIDKSQQNTAPLVAKKTKLPEKYIQLRTAIRTKPFLILGGFSGTGKSQKVKELAYLTCPKELQGEKSPGNYALISVKPNWHDSTDLLGFESSIAHKYMVTDFMRFCVKAMQYPNDPFFCCLDEMNLAPVEEYFAEYLSVLESRKKNADGKIVSEPLVSASVFTKSYASGDIFGELGIEKEEKTIGDMNTHSYTGEALKLIESLKENGLCLPQNLVVIGTVNMDDTTNSFSRKVIDRAMTFETDIERFADIDYFNAENTLMYGNVDGSVFICDEVRSDEAIADGFEVTQDEQTEFINFIDGINEAMNGTSFQVSYRVMNEAVLYYRAMKLLNGDEDVDLSQVFNDILLMKVLPRIEGDTQAGKALKGLAEYMTGEDANLGGPQENESPWKKSYDKVMEMTALLNEGDGFTRFWK